MLCRVHRFSIEQWDAGDRRSWSECSRAEEPCQPRHPRDRAGPEERARKVRAAIRNNLIILIGRCAGTRRIRRRAGIYMQSGVSRHLYHAHRISQSRFALSHPTPSNPSAMTATLRPTPDVLQIPPRRYVDHEQMPRITQRFIHYSAGRSGWMRYCLTLIHRAVPRV